MILQTPTPFDPGAALLSRAEASRAEGLRRPSLQPPSVLDLQHAMGTAGTVEEVRRTLRGDGLPARDADLLVPWLPTVPSSEVGPPPGPYDCINSLDLSCENVVRPVVTMLDLVPSAATGRGPWWIGNVSVTIVPGAEVCQSAVDLVLAALRLLERFTEPGDILDWMVCLLNAAKCAEGTGCIPAEYLGDFDLINLMGYFHGVSSMEARVSLSPGEGGPETQLPTQLPGLGGPTPGEIRLGMADIRFTNVLYAWQRGTPLEQTCAVLRLSAILFHEFLHLLYLPGGAVVHPEPTQDPPFWGTSIPCNPWNVIPNLYLYAARRRFGWEWSRDGSSCCAEPDGPNRMFMSNSISCWEFLLPHIFPQRGNGGSDDMRMCVDGLPILGGVGVDILCPSGIYLRARGVEQMNPGFEFRLESVEAGRMP